MGSASEAAPEPVKAFLARTGIQTWGFGGTPKPSLLCLLSSRAHSGCSLGIQGIISAPKPTGHRKGDRTTQLWAQKQPGTLGCAKGSSQGTGGCSGDPREGTDPILSTAKGKPCGTALPCCGSIWLPGWLRIKHLNFPCHNLFSQPHFLAAGWQRQEFTAIDSKQLLEGRHALLFMHDKPDLAALRGDAGSTVITPLWFKHLKSTLRLSGPVLCTDLAAHLVNSAQ